MSEGLLNVRLEKPVHGGYTLARHDGRVVLVRHGAPGELVTIEVTDRRKVWRADVVDVVEPHPGRIPLAWSHGGPGGVGVELAHLDRASQLAWKEEVITDAIERIGKQCLPVTVSAVGDGDGWATRTRIELTTNDHGRAGMFAHRTNTHIPLADFPLAHPDLGPLELFERLWPANVRVTGVAPSADEPVALVDGRAPSGHPGTVRERVGDYEYQLDANGFWQAHHRAPAVLTQAVLGAVGEVTGATIIELYAGAGLFTVPLADAVGASGRVHALEGNRRAVSHAVANAGARDWVHHHRGDVGTLLASGPIPTRADVVVLDPPRAGAKGQVMARVLQREPALIVYVSCDPAALARDLAIAAAAGYRADRIDGFDLFPHTHHIESLAVLKPVAQSLRDG